MERCQPGIALGDSSLAPGAAITAAAGVLKSLWQVRALDSSPFDQLADITMKWAELVRTRMDAIHPPYDAGLVEMGARLLESLPGTAQRNVLLHGDFNPGNILSLDRQGWAAIDAKPMIGDPAFDPAPLLLQIDPPFEQSDPATVLAERTRLLADSVGLSPTSVLAWTTARSVEWALWYASTGHVDGRRAWAPL
jgi:streptomycin 6-kinase